MQFDFGQNWLDFSKRALTLQKVDEARKDFQKLLSGIDLKGKRFLDIGFGQGLSILLAQEAGAEVYGNDINPKCRDALARTASVMGKKADIPVIVGSILDKSTVQKLAFEVPNNGLYDIVHSWGVLHHTGDMHLALKNAASLVRDNGHFVVAIYNRHITSKPWLIIKWLYCSSPSLIQHLFIALLYPVIFIAKFAVTRKSPFNQMRGMDFYYNVIDWVGGYPYEYASEKELINMLSPMGFSCKKTIPAEVPTGCNEFVFVKIKTNTPVLPDNKSIYNDNWAEWEDIKRYGPMSRHTQRLVKKICSKISFSSLLDVGCGPGVFLDVMQKRFNNIHLAGTDISSTAIELAHKKFPDADFFEVDIAKDSIAGSWDLVTMIDVAEHIENDKAAFVNIRQFCKEYLLVVTLEGTMRPFEPQIGHVRNYKKGELQDKLVRSGYTIVRSINWGWPMYSPLYRNMSQTIDAHKKSMTFFRRLMTHAAYAALSFNFPQKGDLILVLAKPVREK
jgi:2-polyprenyl-6-hydroxyphenyl methylase/3-demethylubiquinone-9 3-methyltransferase